MQYAKNEIGGIVNGVIFHFYAGDEEIAADVLELVEVSEKPPTSIAWNGECLTYTEVSRQIRTSSLGENGWLGIRLTTDDMPLLKKALELFKEDYPALSQMVAEIEDELFGTKH